MSLDLLNNIIFLAIFASILTLLTSMIFLTIREKNLRIIVTSWELFKIYDRQKTQPKKEIQSLLKTIKYASIITVILFLTIFAIQSIELCTTST